MRQHGGGAGASNTPIDGKCAAAASGDEPPEVRLWALLRRSPDGVRFRRQHPIGPFVADFYCPAAKLVIEIDGKIHDYTVARDERRDEFMRGLGLRVHRIAAAEVMADVLSVCEGLILLCGPSTTQLR